MIEFPVYLENGFAILMNAPFAVVAFEARSSFWSCILPAANVSNIMIKTGTSNNKNGDALAKVFIGVYLCFIL